MLSAKRDVSAANRFFKKLMRAEHRRLPFSISVDKNAAYPEAFSTSQAEKIVPTDCKLRRVKYLNNVIEQDHRFIKKKVRASQCFKRFHTAERTLEGIEAINMIRNRRRALHDLPCLKSIFATEPTRMFVGGPDRRFSVLSLQDARFSVPNFDPQLITVDKLPSWADGSVAGIISE
jgi:hypothetical protein